MTRSISQAFQVLLNRQELTVSQQLLAIGRIDTLTKFFNNNFSMYEDVFPIGSYARQTMAAGDKDIDLMAPFRALGDGNGFGKYEYNSSQFLYDVRNELNDRYARTEVSSKKVAVTLDFNTIQVDVVPCFPRVGGGYLMPNGTGGWQATNPLFHQSLINQADTRVLQTLKPVIRLTKDWNKMSGEHLRSFHVELTVERIFGSATMPLLGYPNLMKEVFRCFPSWLSQPMYDPWNGNVAVDDYLTPEKKRTVLNLLDSDLQRAVDAISFANTGKYDEAFEKWNMIFYNSFPARYY